MVKKVLLTLCCVLIMSVFANAFAKAKNCDDRYAYWDSVAGEWVVDTFRPDQSDVDKVADPSIIAIIGTVNVTRNLPPLPLPPSIGF